MQTVKIATGQIVIQFGGLTLEREVTALAEPPFDACRDNT